MKILMTGATGFLGKNVLSLLLKDSRISRIYVISRRKQTHPSPRVQVVSVDLSDPASMNDLNVDVDAVVHLAGLYDFESGFGENYRQNVLPALNMLEKLKELNLRKPVPLLMASTYAVGFGARRILEEKPLTTLPPKDVPYAYTKALAEKVFTDSGLPVHVFRLGVLVGDSLDGQIEKVDGPYYLMRFLAKINRSRVTQLLRYLPLPGNQDGMIPLVPVDCAARAFHQGLFLPEVAKAGAKVYGVYDTESVKISEFIQTAFERLMPGSKPVYLESIHPRALRFQKRLTGIPGDLLRFSMEPVALKNTVFAKTFPECKIPGFESYREVFFKGFYDHLGDRRYVE